MKFIPPKNQRGQLPRVDFNFTPEELNSYANPNPPAKDQSLNQKECPDQVPASIPQEPNNDYRSLTQMKRIDILFDYKILQMPLKQIAENIGVNYSSIRTLVSDFRANGGRTNRLLNYMSKKSLMEKKQRAQVRRDAFSSKEDAAAMKVPGSPPAVCRRSKGIFKPDRSALRESFNNTKCSLLLFNYVRYAPSMVQEHG